MQKGVVNFEDLHEGMKITGKIKNVVDFGAFVDLGIKETALVHISEMSDAFVKDPLDAVKVGDILEFRIISLDKDRKRIGLSRKTETPQVKSDASGQKPREARPGAESSPAARRRPVPVAVRPGGGAGSVGYSGRGGGSSAAGGRPGDDGTMYNPFAEALKKMREKK
jgi:uncharacterized protein